MSGIEKLQSLYPTCFMNKTSWEDVRKMIDGNFPLVSDKTTDQQYMTRIETLAETFFKSIMEIPKYVKLSLKNDELRIFTMKMLEIRDIQKMSFCLKAFRVICSLIECQTENEVIKQHVLTYANELNKLFIRLNGK